MEWYLLVLKNYARFDGRARRSEYWYFTLFSMIFALVLGVVDTMLWGRGNQWIQSVYGLAVALPSIAVAVRRLHDTDRSGWWALIGLVPLVGLILIYFLAQDSNAGTNRYGQNPKQMLA